MTNCQECGHQLGGGRYCTNCGTPIGAAETGAGTGAGPVDDRTMVRQIPPVPPVAPPGPRPVAPPPVLPPAPTTARYPLFADETGATSVLPAGTPPPADGAHSARRTTGWLPWLGVTVVLLLVAGLGVALLTGGEDAPAEATPRADTPTPTPEPEEPPAPADPEQEPLPEPDGERSDLARFADAKAPQTAPPSTDTAGNVTRYEARNLVDGVATTAWRMPGDGTGTELVFTLSEPVELSAVGLVNGYAKSVGTGRNRIDWYAGNRRVRAVEWVFDDGTTVRQDLAASRTLQGTEIDPVTTRTVTLRLVEVSSPGRGRARRDFTAVSDVALVGVPAH